MINCGSEFGYVFLRCRMHGADAVCAFAASYLCDCGVLWWLMVLGIQWLRAGARKLYEGGEKAGAMCGGLRCACDAVCAAQVGDGTSGTNRLTPVALSALSSGVAMVTAGDV